MSTRGRILLKRLKAAEDEFALLLRSCLEECANGRANLFGQSDRFEESDRWCSWPEARRLKALAEEITSIHAAAGERNQDCDRLLKLCALRGAHVPGEPVLAAEFLADIRLRELSRGAGN